MTASPQIHSKHSEKAKCFSAKLSMSLAASVLLAFFAFTVMFATVSCGGKGKGNSAAGEAGADTIFPDTLHAVTLYGPTSFFIYRGDSMGYNYTLLRNLCETHRSVLDLKVARNLHHAIEMLDSGKVQLIAYEVPITEHYRPLVDPCGPEVYTSQVLVQPKIKGNAQITDVTQLVGRDVYVEEDSKYFRRLQNLNDELGGGIRIHTVSTDTLGDEDLIRMVSDGRLPMTVVDSDIAALNDTYFHDLDIELNVSFPQRHSWAVSPGDVTMAAFVNKWFDSNGPQEINRELLRLYYEQTKTSPNTQFDFGKGYISKYDNLFKKYAPGIDWDWRLLAAQSYAESKFNPNARSWVGARGLMQIMPRTGRGYGAPLRSLNNPETSVKVAAKLLKDLDRYLLDYVPNDKERVKFVIGAYNVGIAHVYDAIRLAEKYGLDPRKWDGNVEKALLMKSNPKYYNDPVVKYGYCRGSETSAYVKRIINFYDDAKRQIPQNDA